MNFFLFYISTFEWRVKMFQEFLHKTSCHSTTTYRGRPFGQDRKHERKRNHIILDLHDDYQKTWWQLQHTKEKTSQGRQKALRVSLWYFLDLSSNLAKLHLKIPYYHLFSATSESFPQCVQILVVIEMSLPMDKIKIARKNALKQVLSSHLMKK